MSIYASKTYISDLKYVVHNTPIINKLKNQKIMVTGARGLICSGLIDLLLMSNSINNTNITIYAADYNVNATQKRFFDFPDQNALRQLKVVYYNATEENNINISTDYIIHGASNAHPKAIIEKPVETMLNNFNAMNELLNYAKVNGVRNTLFISSSEIYGVKNDSDAFFEDEYGFLDILNPRNSYSSGKRAGETLCASFSKEYGIHTSIVRPGHIYGPTASEKDSRVGSSFAYSAARKENLVLKSAGNQLRSYCYMLDCDTAILTVLLLGDNANAYNISNPESVITIRKLAELYAKAGNVNVIFDLPTNQEKEAVNPMSNSSLNSTKIENIGWKALFDGQKGTEHTVTILQEEFNYK